MGSTTTDTFLSQMKQEDPLAWQRVATLCRKCTLSLLFRAGVPTQEAEELQQRVLVKVIELFPTKFVHNGQKGAFRCWLREITRNQLREMLRESRRQPIAAGSGIHDLVDRFDDPHSELSHVWEAEYSRHLTQLLMTTIEERFESKTVAAFRCTFLDGKSTAQAAQELDMSPGNVRVAKSRVLAELRSIGEGLLE